MLLFVIVLLSLVMTSSGRVSDVKPARRTTTSIDKKSDYNIKIEETKIKCKLDKRFVSFAISAGLFNKTLDGFDFRNPTLKTMLKKLSPAVIRVGGTRANFMYFGIKNSNYIMDKKSSKEELAAPSTRSSTPQTKGSVPQTKGDVPQPKVNVPQVPVARANRRENVPGERTNKAHNKAHRHRKGLEQHLQAHLEKQNAEVDNNAKQEEEEDEEEEDQEEREDFDDLNSLPRKDKDKDNKDKPDKSYPGGHLTRKEKKRRKLAGFKDFVINPETFDALYELVNKSGNTMLFDVSAFPRFDKSRKWNGENAQMLIDHVKSKNYDIVWQLGNEPNHYKKFSTADIDRSMSGEEVGSDYNDFRKLLNSRGLSGAKVVGPDVTRPKGRSKEAEWIKAFVESGGDAINVFSWHQYYMDGDSAKPTDFSDPKILDKFIDQIKRLQDMLKNENFNKHVWLTETGSAWGGGAKGMSDTYAGMIPWVDKLGVAGEYCIRVVARQSLFSGAYRLIDRESLQPRPDFYASVLFKRLAGNKVLGVTLSKPNRKFRVYAQCARDTIDSLPGSLFLIVINLFPSAQSFSLDTYELFEAKQYLFSAPDFVSDKIMLNGKVLEMQGGKFPAMEPTVIQQPISVPARNIGFYVFEGVSMTAC